MWTPCGAKNKKPFSEEVMKKYILLGLLISRPLKSQILTKIDII